MRSTINPHQLKIEKLVIKKKIKFRNANGNGIKELIYLVEYIDNNIEKYIEAKTFSIQTRSTKEGKPIYKNYNFSDYTDLWSLLKKIFGVKLSITEARKQQNDIVKKIKDLDDRLNYVGPGKGMKPSTTKNILEDFCSDAKNLFIIRENIINEIFNTEDEKLDIGAGGDDDRRKSIIEAISKLGDKEQQETKGIKNNDTKTNDY